MRYDFSKLVMVWARPKLQDRRLSRMSWSTQSNAALRSSVAISDMFPASVTAIKSEWIRSSAVSHE